jgi:transposase InsO family protein
VVKTGNRFAALQPIAQGLLTEFGTTGADAGRGLTLRWTTGPNTPPTISSIRSSSRASHPASPSSPTNGLAERFNRLLKEHAIHGRAFRSVAELGGAVTEFKDRYNRHWRLQKLGFMLPLEAHQDYAIRKAA